MASKAYIKMGSGLIVETERPDLWTDGERLTAKAGKAALLAESMAESMRSLRESLSPGDTVYTVLRHVSSSGMSRRIDLYRLRDDRPEYLTVHAARVLGLKVSEKGGLVVSGGGMDMGFHVVYSLSRAMFGPNYNARQRREAEEKGKPVDPGYVLKHCWL